MIISHKHKFIYLRTRKTASSSMEILLSSICGEDDIITPVSAQEAQIKAELGYRKTQNCFIPFKKWTARDIYIYIRRKQKAQYTRHMPATLVKKYVGDDIWNSYYKFAFERNPYEKVVSLYFWRGGHLEFDSISEFLKSGVLATIDSYDMYSIDKLVAVDSLFQYENLEESLRYLSKKLNLDYTLKMPDYKAKSGHRLTKSHRDLLDNEAKEIIKVVFAREIALFDYKE